jgi:glycosyltransferase involved in cell wall biosynthesis
MKKIIFIGAINKHNLPRGGEEYKNQLLTSLLKNEFNVTIIDTHNWKKNPAIILKMLFQLLLVKHERIVLSASSHSIYKLLKLLHFFPSLPQKIVYFVIGGYMPSAIYSGVFKKKYYSNIRKIVVEGNLLLKQLSMSGIEKNVQVIPNFKRFNLESHKVISNSQDHIFRFVFLSRIHPDKGIYEIMKASEILHNTYGADKITVTFYGNLEKSEESHFKDKMKHPFYYGGELDFMRNEQHAYNELSTFDCMLFPTYWAGEGFPGVLIDAFIAGIPVIATDWNMNKEVLTDGEDAIIIPIKDAQALAHAMFQLIQSRPKLSLMKQNSSKKANQFHINQVRQHILNAVLQ